MDVLQLLQTQIGGRWVAITFHNGEVVPTESPERGLRFCEAVSEASKHSLQLTRTNVTCPGAWRSFAWDARDDAEFANRLSARGEFPHDAAQKAVERSARLLKAPSMVELGNQPNAHVFLSYAQPETAMRLLRLWQVTQGEPLAVEIPSIMGICGNTAVRAHLSERPCMSFGCMDSREYGGIGRDRLALAIPAPCAKALLNASTQYGKRAGSSS